MNSIQWQDTREKVYRRDFGICQYCGISLSDKYHIDHIMPRSRGGKDTMKNLALCCGRCNNQKHDMYVLEYGLFLERRGFKMQQRFSVRILRECGITPDPERVREYNGLVDNRRSEQRKRRRPVSLERATKIIETMEDGKLKSAFLDFQSASSNMARLIRKIANIVKPG